MSHGRATLIAFDARDELIRAEQKHAPMPTAHHGYAVILEELNELWEEIKKQEPSKERMRAEALQVAATAMRFVKDVCGG